MTSLLKADRVSMLGRRTHAGPGNVVRDVAPLRHESADEMDRLQQALLEALAHAEALKREGDERERDALERGHAEGERLARKRLEHDWAVQQETFRNALVGCVDRMDEGFVRLERFALDLAEAAVARLIDDASTRRDLLLETISHHTRALTADAIVVIHVAQDDLPPGSEFLSSLPPHIASRIRVLPDLASGQCRVELRAGTLDIGLDQQAARLALTFGGLRKA